MNEAVETAVMSQDGTLWPAEESDVKRSSSKRM